MSFKPYPKYKESGVEWLGRVPEHWEVKPLKYIARFTSGGTPSKTVESYWNGDVPWASSKDLKSETLADTVDHITQLAIDDGAAFLVPAGTVLVVVRGMILLHTFPVVETLAPMAINQDLKALTPTLDVHPSYLSWLLRGSTNETFGRIDEAAHGTKVLRMESWTSINLPIPPIAEQVSLATFLDVETAKIDALIAEQQRLIELLQEKRQAVISHAVTKGLNPDALMKDSGIEWLGDVPEHWEPRRLGGLYRQLKRQDQSNKQVLSVYRDYGVVPKDSRDDNMNKTPEDLSAYQLVEPGDLVVNKMKAWQGSLGISAHEGITSPDYVVFAPTHKEDSVYLHYILRGRSMADVYRAISNGIRPSQWRLEPDRFLGLTIFVPPAEEQRAIASMIGEIALLYDPMEEECARSIGLLQERRSALISAAVTGQIDVRNLTGEGAAA